MAGGRKPIEEITEKQKEILELIIGFVQENGYQPSRDQLAAMVGATRHAVNQRIEHLVKKGYLGFDLKGGERCLRIFGITFKAKLKNEVLKSEVSRTLKNIFSLENKKQARRSDV